MTLRFDLAPGEKLYLGRTVLVNGKMRIDFAIEGSGPVLRARDYLSLSSNPTILEQLYFCLQQMYLENDAVTHGVKYIALISRALEANEMVPADAAAFNNQIAGGSYYQALRALKKLLPSNAFLSAAASRSGGRPDLYSSRAAAYTT